MGKIISFANQKGGVGKTTTCVNVAAYTAMMGYRTLLVDLDPQGNASSGFGVQKNKETKTIYSVLSKSDSIEKVIQKTQIEDLYIVPATVDLAGAEIELAQMQSRETILLKIFENIKDDLLEKLNLFCSEKLPQLR